MFEWVLKTGNGVAYYTIERWLEEGVDMAFSNRAGGLSGGAFTSANMGLHVEDEPEKVTGNREKFLANFGLKLGQAVCCRQVHGDNVVMVSEQQRGLGAYLYDTSLPDCDGMVTDRIGVALLSFYADCLPVYLFDPGRRVIGMAHSGWKGTMLGIAAKTAALMGQAFGSQPRNMWAAVGPGIGNCCFEISPSLANQVESNFPGSDHILRHEAGRFTWDLALTIRRTLLQAGLRDENICVCSECTACHPDTFFSYRRDRGKTGRMGALLNLRD
ncbi:MAG TPA: peptidoglycan editing factor PgeF [Syntrophomonas sp.]|nr:peptidoglycan editing factor PgeF [Syntrophomonas sp.]